MNWFTDILDRAKTRRRFSGDETWRNGDLERDISMLITPPPPRVPIPAECLHPESCPARFGKTEWQCECAPNTRDERELMDKLSTHESVRPFGAPALKPTIADAYRSAARDIATALDNMLATCEEARAEGLKLIDALNETGDWQDEFLSGYVETQTRAAATMRDAWKKQLEDLRQQNAALKAVRQAAVSSTEGEPS